MDCHRPLTEGFGFQKSGQQKFQLIIKKKKKKSGQQELRFRTAGFVVCVVADSISYAVVTFFFRFFNKISLSLSKKKEEKKRERCVSLNQKLYGFTTKLYG